MWLSSQTYQKTGLCNPTYPHFMHKAQQIETSVSSILEWIYVTQWISGYWQYWQWWVFCIGVVYDLAMYQPKHPNCTCLVLATCFEFTLLSICHSQVALVALLTTLPSMQRSLAVKMTLIRICSPLWTLLRLFFWKEYSLPAAHRILSCRESHTAQNLYFASAEPCNLSLKLVAYDTSKLCLRVAQMRVFCAKQYMSCRCGKWISRQL